MEEKHGFSHVNAAVNRMQRQYDRDAQPDSWGVNLGWGLATACACVALLVFVSALGA